MTTSRKPGGFFDGEPGESIFVKPYMTISSLHENNQAIPPLFQLMEKSGDDRSFTIITLSIIDSQLDKMLQTIMPDCDKLEDNDLTVGFKINILISLKLIPRRILQCADCIRKIRNEFAHEFKLQSLEEIDQKNKDRLKIAYSKFYNEPDLKTKTMHELFKQVAFVAIVGLNAYQENLSLFRETIQSKKFQKELEDEVKKRFEKEEHDIMNKNPKQIEYQGNLKIERFEKGVTKITSQDSESLS